MNTNKDLSRRSFLKGSTAATVGATAFTFIKPELVRGSGNERLRIGLIGCGRRGTQAAQQCLFGNENVELVAMGDLFEDKLESSLKDLRENQTYKIADKVKVDPEHRFVGFDSYNKVLACDIDIVMLAAPPGYRPAHFEAAVAAGKHIFAEKPFGTDATGVRRIMAAAEKARQLKLTVTSGAQRRNDPAYMQTWLKIRDGVIGEITACYAHWVGNAPGPVHQMPRDPKWADMTYQHRSWYSFVWICGDHVVEQHLHNIDVCNWFMGTHPVEVVASGGAAWRPRQEMYGNIYDHFSSDFVYANGVHLSSHCRQYPEGCAQNVSEQIVGTKGKTNCRDLGTRERGEIWNPYVQEHINMVKSIRGTGSYVNDGIAVAESTLTCIMARESAYSGQKITWEMIMNSKQDLQPKSFSYQNKMDVPPLPVPGVYKFI
jgi:predicted dehydrogenase